MKQHLGYFFIGLPFIIMATFFAIYIPVVYIVIVVTLLIMFSIFLGLNLLESSKK